MHVTIEQLTSGYMVEVKRDVVGLGLRTYKHACKSREETVLMVIQEGMMAVSNFDCRELERMLEEQRPKKETQDKDQPEANESGGDK